MVVVKGETDARPEDAPFDLDKSSIVDVADGIEEVDADTEDVTVCARALPTHKLPAPSIVAHHNLIHFQYRSRCPYCVAGHRPNSQHRWQYRGRSHPVLRADCCFPRDSHDEKCPTVCEGRMSPSKAMCASAGDVNGPTDAYALDRLENVLKYEGVSNISCRSGHEPAILSLIETAQELWDGWRSYRRLPRTFWRRRNCLQWRRRRNCPAIRGSTENRQGCT